MFTRVTIDGAALDSFQNVLFSIARFRELTGVYPTRITVVGQDFKRRRFERLHRLALRWLKLRFTYEGVPLANEADEREAAAGEATLLWLSFRFVRRIYSVLWGPVWLSRTAREETRGTELSHANTWVAHRKWASCWSGV
ncbi:hypothetical protein BC826DRAFT_1101604 [Russula brevipes]|nr:hypothetical protein BC826DRAFT_1101604 [Russula brevipes]